MSTIMVAGSFAVMRSWTSSSSSEGVRAVIRFRKDAMMKAMRWSGTALSRLSLCLVLSAIILTGCGKEREASIKAFSDYQDHLMAGAYHEAYALLSDFDKENLSEADFTKWNELASKIVKVDSFAIDGKVDTFRDYKYLGTSFGTTWGLKISRAQVLLVPGAELATYDKDVFRIMVTHQEDGGRVLLLITDLKETIAAYEAWLEQPE
jgi:hypothetical protein